MTVTATYRNGAFVPDSSVSLPEGARVEVLVPEGDSLSETRERFRAVVGAFPPDVLDKMEADIEEAFGRVEPDAWK